MHLSKARAWLGLYEDAYTKQAVFSHAEQKRFGPVYFGDGFPWSVTFSLQKKKGSARSLLPTILSSWEHRSGDWFCRFILFLPVLSPASYFSNFAKKQFPF